MNRQHLSLVNPGLFSEKLQLFFGGGVSPPTKWSHRILKEDIEANLPRPTEDAGLHQDGHKPRLVLDMTKAT